MKQIPISAEARNSNWLKLANVVDVVLVCRDLGEAIRPVHSPERQNHVCNSLPSGLDMLAIHVSCISRLTKRHGEVLTSTMYSNEVIIAEGKSWKLSGEIFKSCNHDELSAITCWDRTTILQAVRDTGTITPSTVSRRIALSGAVVFGTKKQSNRVSVTDFMYNTIARK